MEIHPKNAQLVPEFCAYDIRLKMLSFRCTRRSPGLAGMIAPFFYQTYWHIGVDVTLEVLVLNEAN